MMPSEAAVRVLRSPEAVLIAAQSTVVDWLHLIRAEYPEIPGLHLTRKQVQRLWDPPPDFRQVGVSEPCRWTLT